MVIWLQKEQTLKWKRPANDYRGEATGLSSFSSRARYPLEHSSVSVTLALRCCVHADFGDAFCV